MLGFWDKNNKFAFLPIGNRPNHCWSIYKINPLYTGNCMRIARLNDNAEINIGFKNNKVDSEAILDHCGANTGVVVTFYDQFGASHKTRYFDNSYAPRICIGGSIITMSNGEPALEFGNSSASSIRITTGNVYGGPSTTFFTYQSSYTGLHVFGGSGSVNPPFHLATENGGSIYPESGYGDSNPKKLYVNESKVIDSSSPTSGQFYTALTGNIKIVSEVSVSWNSGNGNSIGMRGDSTTSYFRGRTNTFMIYSNQIKNDTSIFEVMKILNRNIKAY